MSSQEAGKEGKPTSSGGGERRQQQQQQQRVASLLSYARANYETNPTDSLTALLEAMRLGSPDGEGENAANAAMARVRTALGDEIADHVMDVDARRAKAVEIVRTLLADESTMLYQQGREDILRQTMEDGSSVACSRCGGVVPSCRWQQHQRYWCEAIDTELQEE